MTVPARINSDNHIENQYLKLNYWKLISLLRINPDSVQLNTLDRPGAEEGLSPASVEQLEKIRNYFDHPNVEIIARVHKKNQSHAATKDVESTILEIISRRPCTIDDISETLNISLEEANIRIKDLLDKQKITAKKLERGMFYSLAN